MTIPVVGRRFSLAVGGVLVVVVPAITIAQRPMPSVSSHDTAAVAAGTRYAAGALRRFLLGDNYRDLWGAPVRAPVLDLRAFAGGLRPLKEGGGMQTKSLRFVTRDDVEYVFRPIDKDKLTTPARYRHTVVDWIFRDQVSATYPAGALVAAPIVEGAGLLHVSPAFVVMPNDTLLGKYRTEFAGRLGMIEEFPTKPDEAHGFGGAEDIIDSDKLLKLLDTDPTQRVDARAFLAARLVDMLLNDNDRHPGNWKWARMGSKSHAEWEPIPRDRDKVMISYGGIILKLARIGTKSLVTFDAKYPDLSGLTAYIEFDRRLLGGLEKPVWDSVARELTHEVSDSVIDAAVRAVPREYQANAPRVIAKLRQRRDHLADAANGYYRMIANVADIHATDAAERALVRRLVDGMVEVEVWPSKGGDAPFFRRRYDAHETQEIRLYLHGGDDSAVVTGRVARSIPVRIIGGNGTNVLIDSSTVSGRRNDTYLYDAGTVRGVMYGPDTLFNRRPWIDRRDTLAPAFPDRGGKLWPRGTVNFSRDLGALFGVGVNRYRYGFRYRPYSSRIGVEADYSTRVNGTRITIDGDKRFESSALHLLGTARMSQLEVVNFHGFGNDTPDGPFETFRAQQRQWFLYPAVAYALGQTSDVSFGPFAQYSTTDSTPGRYVAENTPYGFRPLGEAGMRLDFRHDTRDVPRGAHKGLVIDFNGTAVPGLWNVRSAFEAVSIRGATYLTIPMAQRPVLALRGGAKKVFGDFPFQDAAFLGGGSSVRTLDHQRYAGDAVINGTAELRVPVARFSFFLPFDVGVMGFADAGRVYLDGASPNGWHTAAGGGLWFGIIDPATGFSVTLSNTASRRVLIGTGLSF
jgi:hypothetical protein